MRQLRFSLDRTWGGKREGAGRKPAPGRRRTSHRRRAVHDPRCPVHVTLRAQSGLPSLRHPAIFPTIRRAMAAASTARFRLVQFSVQADHVHLLVEADDPSLLGRGLQGLAIRLARAVNRVLGRRGKVWADRYHARALRTPREVRLALVYVLQNFRKHFARARGVDPCSSAPWFTGWRTAPAILAGSSPVRPARTWLGSVGWKRYGPLEVSEGPRGASVTPKIRR